MYSILSLATLRCWTIDVYRIIGIAFKLFFRIHSTRSIYTDEHVFFSIY